MHFERREKSTVLYLSTGSQAITLPADVDRDKIQRLLREEAPPGSGSRRNTAIAVLRMAGIKAS